MKSVFIKPLYFLKSFFESSLSPVLRKTFLRDGERGMAEGKRIKMCFVYVPSPFSECNLGLQTCSNKTF